MILRFAYPKVFLILFPIFILALVYRFLFYKSPVYTYPLAGLIKKYGYAKNNTHKVVLFVLRGLALFLMIFFIARPQWMDFRSKINVDGVDMMITLDVSGSMQLFDDLKNPKPRIEVAKFEAIKFINKRENDPIGVVVFGAESVSKCPLTLDKQILKNVVSSIKLGDVNHNGTSLATGLATAVNRLKNSASKSRIIILLTDGQPTPQTEKVSIENSIALLKEFGIKTYTIAIGNVEGGFVRNPFGFVDQVRDSVDEELLKKIANETNGKFFRANNPKEMSEIYDTIDQLEKTKRETDMFSRYYEAFCPFIWIVTILFLAEILLKLFVWQSI